MDSNYSRNLFTLSHFAVGFSVFLFISIARTLQPLCRFYKWFHDSGFAISKHRGYGQTACKFYGLFPSPVLSPSALFATGLLWLVSVAAIAVCAGGTLSTLLTSSSQDVALAAVCFCSLLLYHVYLSQLFCEAHVGAHVTVMIPPALLLLTLYFVARSEKSAARVPDEKSDIALQVYFAFLLKCVVLLAYNCAGVSKLKSGFKNTSGKFWTDGSTLQACIFEALSLSGGNEAARKRLGLDPHVIVKADAVDGGVRIAPRPAEEDVQRGGCPHYSFGVPTPFSDRLQAWVLDKVVLLRIASCFSVYFELLAFLVLVNNFADLRGLWVWLPLVVNWGFGVAGLGFHYGIALLQNVDFLSWWGPVYVVFLTDPVLREPFVPLGAAAADAAAACPVSSALGTLYVGSHVVMAILIQTGVVTRMQGREYIPYSGYQMFSDLKDLFDPAYPKTFWLSEKPHATGTLKNYAFPLFGVRPPVLTETELLELPWRYMSVTHNHAEKAGAIRPANANNIEVERKHQVLFTPEKDPTLKKPLLQQKVESIANVIAGVGPNVRVVGNVEISAKMKEDVLRIAQFGALGTGQWRDRKNIAGLLQAFEALREEFLKSKRLAPRNVC